jgi:hypothetical protein
MVRQTFAARAPRSPTACRSVAACRQQSPACPVGPAPAAERPITPRFCAVPSPRPLAHAPTMGQTLLRAAFLGFLRRNPEAVAIHSQALADIRSRYDLPAWWAGIAVFFQGWAKRTDSAEGSGLAEMRRGLATYREQGFVLHLPSLEAALAEAEASAGETDAGLRRLDDALAQLERTEARSNCAPRWLWRSFIARPIATPMRTPCWRRRSKASRRPNNSPSSLRRKPCSRR